MRKSVTYILLLCALLSLGSCDFLRRTAGRPTSEDIEIMRQRIVADSLAEKALADSIELARQLRIAYLADSLAVCDSLMAARCYIKTPQDISSAQIPELSARYWLVTGAFKNQAYADRRVQRLKDGGFESQWVSFGNSLKVVLAAPNNTIRGVYDDYKRFMATDQSVSDVWILDAGKSAVE